MDFFQLQYLFKGVNYKCIPKIWSLGRYGYIMVGMVGQEPVQFHKSIVVFGQAHELLLGTVPKIDAQDGADIEMGRFPDKVKTGRGIVDIGKRNGIQSIGPGHFQKRYLRKCPEPQ